MPRFEVRSTTVYQYDADSQDHAKWLMEYGEIPSKDNDPLRVFVSSVERIVTDEEREQEQKMIEQSIMLSKVKSCLDQ
jgi:hypothetical protein